MELIADKIDEHMMTRYDVLVGHTHGFTSDMVKHI